MSIVTDGDSTTPPSGGGSADPSTFNLTGTYAALPSAGTAGRIYIPNNSVYDILRDNGSSWDHFAQGKKLVPPVDGDYSWVNQGSATVDTTFGGIVLSTPATVGNNLRLRVKSAPSTPYTITTAMIVDVLNHDFGMMGACFRESGTGRIQSVGVVSSASASTGRLAASEKWTNATTFSAGYVTINFSGTTLVFIRIADDGVNRISSISFNGLDWFAFHTVTRTDFLTADQVGFVVNTNGPTRQVSMHLLGWEEA